MYKNKRSKGDHIILAIDVLNYMNKYRSNIISGFFLLIMNMYNTGIIPICVFDGKQKDYVFKDQDIYNKKRKYKKKKERLENEIDACKDETKMKKLLKLKEKKLFKIKNDDVKELKELFDNLNVYYCTASSEADLLIAKMYHENIIDGAITLDSDFLAFGIGRVINYHSSHDMVVFEITNILDKLKIDFVQFVDYCLMFESEYFSPKIYGKGIEIFNNFKKNDFSYIKTFSDLSFIPFAMRHKIFEKKDKLKEFYLRKSDELEFSWKPIIPMKINVFDFDKFHIKESVGKRSIETYNRIIDDNKFALFNVRFH